MTERDSTGTFRNVAGLFTIAFVGVLLVLALLGNFGLPDTALGTTLGVGVILAFALAGIGELTMRASEFYAAGSNLPSTVNGIASAAAFLSATSIVGFAGVMFADLPVGIAIAIGWSVGFLLLAVLIAPYLRKSGAYGVADFMAMRFRSRSARLLGALIVVAILAPSLAAAIAVGATAAEQLFALPARTATILVVVLVLAGTLFGGMRAITLTALAQYIVLAIAFLAPAAILSILHYSLPIPQFAAGLAYQDAAALAGPGDLAAVIPSRIFPFAPKNGFDVIAGAVAFAAGVAALPHLLMRQSTLRNVAATRASAGWSLVFVLLVALTVPAYAAFAKLSLLTDIVGSTIDALPDWLFELGQRGMAMLCGADATSIEAVRDACVALNGSAGPVAASDLAIGADVIVSSWGDIVGLPYVVTALIAVGVLSAALAAASAMSLAVAGAIGYDLFTLVAPQASSGRRLVTTRLMLIVTVLGCTWLGARNPDAAFALSLAAVSLSASALFPVLVLSVWWPRINATGAITGMLAGGGAVAAVVVEMRFPGALPLDIGRAGLTELTAAMVGIPIGFLAAIGGSLVTKPPSLEVRAIVDAIRQPGGGPVVDRSAS